MNFIWNEVSEWLYPSDIFVLCLTNKFIHQINSHMIYKNISRIIKQKLSLFIEDPDDFLKNLSYHKHYLSGSFLLQCLNGDNWPDSDIDCYFIANEKCTSYNKEGDDILAHDFSHNLLITNQVHHGIPLTYTGLPVFSYHYKLAKNSSKVLNLIQIQIQENKNVFDYVSKICDFAFTKILFDGINLFVYDWNSIITKYTIVNVDMKDHECESLVAFCDKYYLHRIITRIVKYEKRGFRLEINSKKEYNFLFNHITKCNGQNHRDCECGPDPDPNNLVLGDEKNYLIQNISINDYLSTNDYCPIKAKKWKQKMKQINQEIQET